MLVNAQLVHAALYPSVFYLLLLHRHVTTLCHLRDFDAINWRSGGSSGNSRRSHTLLCCCIWRARFTVFAVAIATIVIRRRRRGSARAWRQRIAIHGDQAVAAAVALRGAGGGQIAAAAL